MAANAVAVADRQAQAQESGLDASGRPVVHKVCARLRKRVCETPCDAASLSQRAALEECLGNNIMCFGMVSIAAYRAA